MVSNTDQYLYDANANMTYDPSKKITVSYNPLNLPSLVEFDNNDFIEYTYTATGTKLRKTVTSWKTTTGGTTDYAGQFLYQDNELSCIFTSVGRIVPVQYNDETYWKHEYSLKDHLGNTRVVFAAHSHGQPEVMQQTGYYPFGMTLQQQNFGGMLNQPNKLLYNSKELQDDELAGVSLNWYDYGFRFYDPMLARWHVPDPKADNYFSSSSYNYCANNPIIYIDPNGDTLAIANNQITIDDINSLVLDRNQHYLTFSDDGSFSQVNLNFENMSQEDINTLLASDAGLTLLSNMVNAGENYLYEASEIALVRNEAGDRTGIPMFRDNNGIINASNGGLDANGTHTYRPAAGYDGHLVISSQGSWSEVNGSGTVVSKSRRSIVFHEMAKNYERTTNGVNYHGSGLKRGAHALAISQERSWHGKSLAPGGIAPNGYSNPYTMKTHGVILNAIYNQYLIHGFDLK